MCNGTTTSRSTQSCGVGCLVKEQGGLAVVAESLSTKLCLEDNAHLQRFGCGKPPTLKIPKDAHLQRSGCDSQDEVLSYRHCRVRRILCVAKERRTKVYTCAIVMKVISCARFEIFARRKKKRQKMFAIYTLEHSQIQNSSIAMCIVSPIAVGRHAVSPPFMNPVSAFCHRIAHRLSLPRATCKSLAIYRVMTNKKNHFDLFVLTQTLLLCISAKYFHPPIVPRRH